LQIEKPKRRVHGILNQQSEINNQQLVLRCSSGKGQQRNVPCLLDSRGQPVLMRRTHSRQTPGHNLAALRDKLPEQPVILVVDVGNFLGAELANFLAPEKLSSTLARGTARTGSPGSTAAKSRTISAAGTLAKRPRGPLACRWCFNFVAHSAPS
jgi:hypothetical protein